MIGIVDYGLGNLKAFANIYAGLNVPFFVARDAEALSRASRIILPGVGAFDQAMDRLQRSGMRQTLDDLVLKHGVPVLGVCVGLQIMMRSSEEGSAAGLGWIDGEVVRFVQSEDAEKLRIPHMGWNNVQPARQGGLFAGMDNSALFYFLHSYYTRCSSPDNVLARTLYGGEFACALNRANIYGVQFHPEKSHQYGIRLLQNFSEL